MNRSLSFLGGLLVLALAACDGATAPDLSSGSAPGSAAEAAFNSSQIGARNPLKGITLGLGQTFTDEATASEFTFNAILSEKRCPAYLDCVEPGAALAEFTFMDGDGTEHALKLEIPGGSPLELDPKSVEPAFAGGHAFRLIRLQPYPGYAPDYAPNTGPPVKATVVIEPCGTQCG